MKKFIAELIERLSSRKFLLTVGTGLILIANSQFDQLVILVAGYVGIEGLADTAERYAKPRAEAAQASLKEAEVTYQGLESPLLDVDKTQFAPGERPAGM